MTSESTINAENFFSDIQNKVKAAYDAGTSAFGEVGTLTKGNVEAFMESGKILASGLQDLGATYTAEGKAALESLKTEIKDLSVATSPTDFYKMQGDFVRRNFESAFALIAKSNEAFLKLAKDAAEPLAQQTNAALATVRKAG